MRVCTVNLTQSLSERASDMSTHKTLSPSVRSIGTVLAVLPPVGPGPKGTTVSAGTAGSIILVDDEDCSTNVVYPKSLSHSKVGSFFFCVFVTVGKKKLNFILF